MMRRESSGHTQRVEPNEPNEPNEHNEPSLQNDRTELKNFEDISYLAVGTSAQAEVHALLARHRVMEKLESFGPMLVGTVPIGINVEGSDLDIICCVNDFDEFRQTVEEAFGREAALGWGTNLVWETKLGDDNNRTTGVGITGQQPYITCQFRLENWPVELFGHRLPVLLQNGYRHMAIEDRLLRLHGSSFRERIMRLKSQGFKTEPAFADLLRLEGDPYEALLALEKLSDEKLQALQSKES